MEIVTRDAAIAAGLKSYFTGEPCKHGHISPRNTKEQRCMECLRLKMLAYRKKNPEKFAGYEDKRRGSRVDYTRERYQRNRAAAIASVLAWREKNRARFNATRAKWQREKFATDPTFALELRIRGAINDALRQNGFSKKAKAASILGCTWPEFKAHIERQFLPGMTWANRCEWHIDHIVALATAQTEADVLALNHFTNLRPMWGPDNLKKGAKQTHLI